MFYPFWKMNVTDKWAKQIVKDGYYIPFHLTPPWSLEVKRTILPKHQHSLLLEEIQQMLQKNAIERVDPKTPGFYSTFFLVPKKDGGQRPVLNLKGLNQFVHTVTFKMQTLQVVIKHLNKGDWMASLDLKDAYFHVPIREDHRPFLRFEFLGQVYQFRVLPFGLSTAPRVFTKVLAPIVAILHRKGIFLYPYLDDCLLVAKSKELLIQAIQITQQVLMEAGFVINQKKSFLTPVQRLKFLGMELDTMRQTVFLPLDKVQQLVQCVSLFLPVGQYRTVHLFLRLLGLMTASMMAVPQARLYMRPIQLYLNAQAPSAGHNLNRTIMLPLKLLPVFRWWADIANLTPGRSWVALKPSLILTTDASMEAWGAHLNQFKLQGRWTSRQVNLHINNLEMLAVHKALLGFEHLVQGRTVLVQTDNTTVLNYINKAGGTRSPQMCQLTWDMFQWCIAHQVQLVATHIPGRYNVLADKLSRQIVPQTEWELNSRIVNALFRIWGKPSIDLFASFQNRKINRFCSLFPHQQAVHRDALTLNWSKMYAYAFPPIAILSLVLRKIATEETIVILIAPIWPRREWYPLLLNLSVDCPRRLPVLTDLVTQQGETMLHSNPAELCLGAWSLSGMTSLQEEFRSRLQTQFYLPRASKPNSPIDQAGTILLPGARREVVIPMLPLSL
jgi:hypothetical protein